MNPSLPQAGLGVLDMGKELVWYFNISNSNSTKNMITYPCFSNRYSYAVENILSLLYYFNYIYILSYLVHSALCPLNSHLSFRYLRMTCISTMAKNRNRICQQVIIISPHIKSYHIVTHVHWIGAHNCGQLWTLVIPRGSCQKEKHLTKKRPDSPASFLLKLGSGLVRPSFAIQKPRSFLRFHQWRFTASMAMTPEPIDWRYLPYN